MDFPILDQRHGRERAVPFPPSVPWAFVAPHEEQAQRNHSQTLRRLAERGGLSPCELIAVVEGRRWRSMDDAAAVERLRELLAAWSAVDLERFAFEECERLRDAATEGE